MALALALVLAGFEEEDFRGLMSLCSLESDRKILPSELAAAATAAAAAAAAAEATAPSSPRTASPSNRSESSGISSFVSSTTSGSSSYPSSATSSLSSASSRSETPESGESSPKPPTTKADTLLRALHKKRDILNLGENLNDPSWNLKSPSMPRNDTKSYMANRSVHHRLGPNALAEDYPTRVCRHCGFTEPSPYLF